MTMMDSHASAAICFAADQIKLAFEETARELRRPCVVFKPTLARDGNKWCALFGENLMEGVSGFGDTPEQAMAAFDVAWYSAKPFAEQEPTDE